MARKSTLGCRKIEKKYITCQHARGNTFSKRKSGLFKKASELCTLTGCEISLVVFSQAGRAFSFGHPSTESVAQKFLNRNQVPVIGMSVDLGLDEEFGEIREQHDSVKKRGQEFPEARSVKMPFQSNTPIHELSLEQLIKAKEQLEKLQEKVEKRIVEISPGGSGKRTWLNQNVGDFEFDLNISPGEDEM